jgi:hypothetical protein
MLCHSLVTTRQEAIVQLLPMGGRAMVLPNFAIDVCLRC